MQFSSRLIVPAMLSSIALLSSCGGDSNNPTTSDPFAEIESTISDRNVQTATIDGLWMLVTTIDEKIDIDDSTEAIEQNQYTRYQVLNFDQGAGGGIGYDMCAGNSPAMSHVFGYNLTANSLTISVGDFFHVDYEIMATVQNNKIIDLGEFRASGNNDITYRAKAYKFRDDVNSAIGSLNTNIGNDPIYCLDFRIGTRTALFSQGSGDVPFHLFSISSNSIWLYSSEEQSTPVMSDITYSHSGELYSQISQANFSFQQSTFPDYSGSFSLVDAESGLTKGTFNIDLSE